MASNRDKDQKQSDSSGDRGFASMDEDKQREIASKGSHAAHEKGATHEFTSEEAREARKGRESSHGGGGQGGSHGSDYSSSTHGKTSEQHTKTGSQSHKNK